MSTQTGGIYRCSNDGQTIFADIGENIPPCSCGKGTWLFLKEDQYSEVPLDRVHVNNPFQAIMTDEIPEDGLIINIIGGMMQKFDGAYVIDRVEICDHWPGAQKFLIHVTRVSDFQPNLPLHRVVNLGC